MEGRLGFGKATGFLCDYAPFFPIHESHEGESDAYDEMMRRCDPPVAERDFPKKFFLDPAKNAEALESIEKLLKNVLDRARVERRIAKLEAEVRSLVAANKGRAIDDCLPVSKSITVPITTFAPDPYEPIGTIYIVIEHSNGSFIASFLDANINTSGDSESEAMEDVKARMLNLFERLESTEDSKLGPGPRRQKKILQTLIRRTK